MLTYLLEVTLCWFIFYSIFFLALRTLTFFRVNRWYLLSTIVIGLLIPQLRHIELDVYQEEVAQVAPIVYVIKDAPAQFAVTVSEQVEQTSFNWSALLWSLYLIGLAYFLFRFFKGLVAIRRLYVRGIKESKNNYTLVTTNEDHLPFSFFRYVFISDTVSLKEEYDHVIQHEISHVDGRHSLDVIFLEVINILFWFNPMIYLYKTALRQTHEYLADEAVLSYASRKKYGTLLLKQSLSGLQIALTHQFFHSHIKKRINMMYQKKSGRSAWLKYVLALPVLVLLLVVFSGYSQEKNTENMWSYSEATHQHKDYELPDKWEESWVEVTVNGKLLLNKIDYFIDESAGLLNIINEEYKREDVSVNVQFDEYPPTLKKEALTSKQRIHPVYKKLDEINSEGSLEASNRENQDSRTPCPEYDNGFARPGNSTFGKIGCGYGYESIECINNIIQEYADKFDIYSSEARKSEFVGLTYFDLIIDEKGKAIDLKWSEFQADLGWGLEEEGKRLLKVLNTHMDFIPSTCQGEPTKTLVHIQLDHELSQSEISRITKIGPNDVKPNSDIRIMNISEVDGVQKVSFSYFSNMNVASSISIINSEGDVIFRKVEPYMYKLLSDHIDLEYLKPDSYVLEIDQDGVVKRENFEIEERGVIFREVRDRQDLQLNNEVHLVGSDSDPSCKQDKNGYVFGDNNGFGLVGCESIESGEERKNCTRERVREIMISKFSYPEEARKNGKQGRLFYELLIDEMGHPEGIRNVAVFPRELMNSEFTQEVDRIYNQIKDDLKFTPSLCDGSPAKTKMIFPIDFKLNDADIEALPIKDSKTVIPSTKLVISGYSKNQLSFEYHSNMNVLSVYSIVDPNGDVISEDSKRYFYKKHSSSIEHNVELLPGTYALKASQGDFITETSFTIE